MDGKTDFLESIPLFLSGIQEPDSDAIREDSFYKSSAGLGEGEVAKSGLPLQPDEIKPLHTKAFLSVFGQTPRFIVT